MDYDQQFVDSLTERNIVMGIVFHQDDGLTVNQLPSSITSLDPLLAFQLPIFKPNGFTSNLNIFTDAAPQYGFFDNPNVDSDGLFRKVPLLQSYQSELYPSLALSLAATALDHPGLDIQVEQFDDYIAIEKVQLGRLLIWSMAIAPFRSLPDPVEV